MSSSSSFQRISVNAYDSQGDASDSNSESDSESDLQINQDERRVIFDLQESLITHYKNGAKLRFNRTKEGTIDIPSVVAINDFIRSNDLSTKQADSALKLICHLNVLNKRDPIAIPASTRGIQRVIHKNLRQYHTVLEYTYRLPVDYFGIVDKPCAIGVAYDIHEVLAKMFCAVDPKDFQSEPVIQQEKDSSGNYIGPRIFEGYSTCVQFEKLTKEV